MLPEVKAIEPQLKQILYGCVEHVQATKAALYLSSSHDLNHKTYELVTSYQYNIAGRKTVTANDDLVDRLVVKRSPFYVNGVGADQRFSEMLFRQGNDRLLVAPIFSRGRLVGFIDMRDKAGKKPFETPDVEAAGKIAEELMKLLGTKNLFGFAPISLVQDSSRRPANATSSEPLPQVVPMAAAQPVVPRAGQLSAQALAAITAARETMSRRQLNHGGGKHMLTERDLEVVRLLLPATLAIPGAVLGCFSAMGHHNNPQSIVAIATVTDDAMELLQAHIQEWLKKSNQPAAVGRPQLIYPFGGQVVPVSAAAISTILSAPVNAQSVEGLVLTVAFERTPEAQAQRALHIFLRQVEQSVEAAIAAGAGRNDRQSIAEKLLEPDFQKYPDLMEHSRQVANIAQRFAIALELSPAQVETVRLAALVHDVGMRLLDYERIYRRPNLTAEELRGLAEHPIVGAALVEPLLGPDVAQAVLRHHERVDGKGYPSRMTGQQIPLASRILQIADAWVAMTSSGTYQA
ncbi:MAG: metal-dependent phosphohydrolase, partial [Acidobacteria bacterium]|nr:metal-dependent phosphohydrolase [Acidobacteriota bacterium]